MINRLNGIVIVILASVLLSSCATFGFSGSSTLDPVKEEKKRIEERYKFFMKDEEKKDLKNCQTEECVRLWVNQFCSVRDCGQIDKRIGDIENEIYATDLDIPGFTFRRNGRLRGDVANVYLLHGNPDFKDQLVDNYFLSDLMLWAYIDESGLVYRYLFYRKGGTGSYRLFEYQQFRYIDKLIEISRRRPTNNGDFESIERELMEKDSQWLYRSAMAEFSTFHSSPRSMLGPPDTREDVVANLGAKILGQPVVNKDLKFNYSEYSSFIPGIFSYEVKSNSEGDKVYFYFISKYSSHDWLVKESGLECHLYLRIIFTNRDSGEILVYESGIILSPRGGVIKDTGVYFPFMIPRSLDGEKIFDAQLMSLDDIPPGSYIVEAYLKNVYTQKYNVWTKDFVR